jgi:two-component system phosphate regulon response regulator PhoB
MVKFTLLIVDDEVAIRDMIRISLEHAGFNVISAKNASEAYIKIIDLKPDLVLLDWMLPGGSGIELARRLRRDDITRDLPIIMLTARASEDNMVQGLDEGADDYVVKPFSPKELIARIRSVLRRNGDRNTSTPLRV